MDLRTRTALFCAALALALATSGLLRSRVRRTQGFLAQALFGFYGNGIWERATELLAVLVPQLAVRLFTAIVPRPPAEIFAPGVSIPPPASTTRPPPAQLLVRVASVLAVPMVALAL